MTILWCASGDACEYGEPSEDDDGTYVSHPAQAYSQEGHPMYMGLCLNCLDDHRRAIEDADHD